MINAWISMIFFLCVQTSFAHESAEEIAALATAKELQQAELLRKEQLNNVQLKHSAIQEYVEEINDWRIRLQIFPPSAGTKMTEMHVFVSNLDEVEQKQHQISILLMDYDRKTTLTPEKLYYKGFMRLPEGKPTMLMIKVKTENGEIFFVRFQH